MAQSRKPRFRLQHPPISGREERHDQGLGVEVMDSHQQELLACLQQSSGAAQHSKQEGHCIARSQHPQEVPLSAPGTDGPWACWEWTRVIAHFVLAKEVLQNLSISLKNFF